MLGVKSSWMAVLAILGACAQDGPRAEADAPGARAKLPLVDMEDRIAAADLVIQGVVTDVRYGASEDGGPDTLVVPHTFVTWRVERTLSGRPDGDEVTLRFVGGRAEDGRWLHVSEVPTFQVGERAVLLVRDNGHSGCPLVDCARGRLPADADTLAEVSEIAASFPMDPARTFRSASPDQPFTLPRP